MFPEEGVTIRRERRPGELFFVEAIEREWESAPMYGGSRLPTLRRIRLARADG